jgi:5-methylcytosine-specific restriction protein B
MALHTEHETKMIYQVAQNFLGNCLLLDGSLLFQGESVWTSVGLEHLHKVFVATPDESDRSFLTKFKEQIEPAGREVIRLAAELMCVYFLFPSNVGGPRKREVVNEILGWAGEHLPAPSLVNSAFANGIGSGGQGYNTRRPFEIGFLIEFAIAWKKLTPQQQSEASEDPMVFQEHVDRIEDAQTKQLRHMLLYLIFPKIFERIASGNHKRRIVRAFAGLLNGASVGGGGGGGWPREKN